jgi:potassium/chloride transporter 4/5/6
MFMISWTFTVVSLNPSGLIYYYVSLKGKAGDWGDGFKTAYFQLALRSIRSLGGRIFLHKNKHYLAELQAPCYITIIIFVQQIT